ncbi:MAG TPA: HAD-IA family hydrolase, partial [Vicinamibacteria bacterium]
MPFVPRAVILDFDGLIVDTETPIFESWRTVYARRGQELRIEEWQHALGTHGGFDPFAHLGALLGERLAHDTLLEEVQALNRAACDAQPLLPGVEALVHAARQLGLGTAVASSSTRGWVEGWLARHGIRALFDVLCGREDVAAVKPAPDLFLLAAERLGVPPGACVVFEDSPNGMRAAAAAGMRCVAVPIALMAGYELPPVSLQLELLSDFTLDELLAK